MLIDDLSLTIPPGAIVGIIGPNGAGKSTLFKMITGQLKPDSGEVNIGHTVKVAYGDQSREKLEGDKNVWQEVSGGSGDGEKATDFASAAQIILDGGVVDYDGNSGPITFDENGDPTEATIGIFEYGADNKFSRIN